MPKRRQWENTKLFLLKATLVFENHLVFIPHKALFQVHWEHILINVLHGAINNTLMFRF